MAYLGPPPSQKLATPTSQYFSGNGSTTAFTLNRPVNVSEDLNVFVNNVPQEPGSGKSYTATGTALTFDAAPASGTNNIYVVYRGLAEPTTRLEHPSGQPLAATTGTFSGAVSGTTGTFSGNVTIGGNLSVTGTAPSEILGTAELSQDKSQTTTSTTYVSTGATITIPAATVATLSKIIIFANGSMRVDQNTHSFIDVRIQRTAPSAANFAPVTGGDVAAGSESYPNTSVTAIDSSLGTGDHTYTVYVRKSSGNPSYAATIYYNYEGHRLVAMGT